MRAEADALRERAGRRRPGGLVTQLGGTDVATALAALMPYVSGDNLSTWRLHRPEQAVIPAFLEAAGLDASIAVDGTTYTDLPTLPIAS